MRGIFPTQICACVILGTYLWRVGGVLLVKTLVYNCDTLGNGKKLYIRVFASEKFWYRFGAIEGT